MNIDEFSVVKRAKQDGCKAKTIKGIVRYIRKFGLGQSLDIECYPNITNETMTAALITSNPVNVQSLALRLTLCPLWDPKLHTKVLGQIDKNGRARLYGEISVCPEWHLRMAVLQNGTVGGWPSYDYYGYYHSTIAVTCSGRTAYYLSEGKLKKEIRAPRGLSWGHDDNGAYLVSKDGTEYHPTVSDLQSKWFVGNIRDSLSRARIDRTKARKEASRMKRAEKEMSKCRVTLQDARAVGACVNGIVMYLRRTMGMDRREALSPYASVSGKRLLAEGTELARLAVYHAYQRETMVSI